MMMQEGGVKIWRPRQVGVHGCQDKQGGHFANASVHCDLTKVYVGPSKRDYVPIDNRETSESPRTLATAVEHSG